MYCNGLLRNKDIYTFNLEAVSEWLSDQLLVFEITHYFSMKLMFYTHWVGFSYC